MKYTLIKGSFFVVGQSPDADSVKFRATDPSLWQHIDTENRNAFEKNFTEGQGVVQLRFEGVDALETHYTPSNPPVPEDVKNLKSATLVAPTSKGYKQLPAVGSRTTDQMLDILGATGVKWRTAGVSRYITEAVCGGVVVREKLKDVIPGYIITGDVEMNGRPIAWIYVGTTAAPDGMTITADQLVAGVEESINYQLLQRGLVYPYYFMSLTGKLRSKLSSAVQEAQAAALRDAQAGKPAGTNVWSLDSTVPGINLTGVNVITDERAIYPYLFRKILKYQFRQQMEAYWSALRTNATAIAQINPLDLTGFFTDANPYVFVISDQDFVRLSDVVEVKGTAIKMKKSPHDLVFLSL